jgi:thiaminase (transcriptional activator TenA)
MLGEGSTVSAQLRAVGCDSWQAAIDHPMVKGIASGSLPHAVFRHYFQQNIAYLEDYARAVAMVTSKAPDRGALVVLANMTAQIISIELPANRSFLARLGGDADRSWGVADMEPTTYSYTRHLLSACAFGDCADGLSALLPCQWSYGEIAAAVAGARPADPIYADWLSLFGDPEYAALVDGTTALLDRLASPAGPRFERLRLLFEASTRYEVEFWDMAYRASRPAPRLDK